MGRKSLFNSICNNKKGKMMDAVKNKRSNGMGRKSLFNSIVFGKEIIMKKIKQKIKKWMMVGVSGAIALAMGSVAFAQEMVKDPSTGGTMTTFSTADFASFDPFDVTGNEMEVESFWLEGQAIGDWSVDREKWDFMINFIIHPLMDRPGTQGINGALGSATLEANSGQKGG